jgi:UDP-N-acetylmuramoyl-L-alanyl-D-glutamate--2,6-diaminopimelate ligase
MTLIAVTGTKGKTTTAHILREIFTAAGYKTGMIGTLGAFIGNQKLADTANTTPEPIALHRILRQMADEGCTHAVLEASSQAMKLRRLSGITFDAALFLNLTPDHIGPGEHADFEEYRACKGALFRQCRLAVGNSADANWPLIAPKDIPVVTFETAETRPLEGLSTLLLPDYRLALPGKYNGQNALAALTLCRALDIPDSAIRQGLTTVSVPGRCEFFPNHRGFTVLMDYAHNGDSFRALLSTLKEYPHRRLVAVFGAGGDRPKLRRQDMARAAAEWADFAVITADNPRCERAEDICWDISRELTGRLPHEVIPDRREAICYALDRAKPEDIVALLGKGHEEYMEINGVKHPFSEKEVLAHWFGCTVSCN